MKSKVILLIIVSLAFVIRFWGLGQNPVSPNWDEVSLGYNAYSILKTGKDEWGKQMPLIFPAFGDYKLPTYIYLLTPLIYFFGLSVSTIRLLSVISGTFVVFGSYLVTNEIFKKFKISFTIGSFSPGHFSAFFMCLLPWHLFLSRPALEASLGLSFFIFGIYFLLKSHQSYYLVVSSLFFGLSMHTYNSYRVIIPLITLAYLLILFRTNRPRPLSLLVSIALATCFAFLIFSQIKNGAALARYQKLKILNENTVYQIGESRQKSQLLPIFAKAIYNKPVYFSRQVLQKYLSYFGPQFWNQSRGAQYQFAIPNQNLLTLPLMVLVILGLVCLSKSLNNSYSFFLFVSFFISPVAASLTIDPPQAIRPSPLIVFIPTIATLGLHSLVNKFKSNKEYLIATVLLLFTLFSSLYQKDYWSNYQTEYSSSWQYGYEQVYAYLNQINYDNRNVFITKRLGEPHIFYLFYNQIDPNLLFDTKNSIRFSKSDWLWTDKINNYYFLNDWQISTASSNFFQLESGQKVPSANSILVTSPDHLPQNALPVKTIDYLNGQPALIIALLP